MGSVEHHFSGRGGWLRAAVLGANDGTVSTASLVTGIATASSDTETVLVGGFAGLVAGALSMGVGEFVSVSAERDAQRADVRIETEALASRPAEERAELVESYQKRGLDAELAGKVADQLMAHDALGAHLREELNLDPHALSSPFQAAFASMTAFTAGAIPAVVAGAVAPPVWVVPAVMATATSVLAVIGALSARFSGASPGRGLVRVVVGGLLAISLSALIGAAVGVTL